MKQGVYISPFLWICIRRAAWATALPGNQEDTQRSTVNPPSTPPFLSHSFLGLNCWVPCLFGDSSKLPLDLYCGLFSGLLMFTDTLGSLFGYR